MITKRLLPCFLVAACFGCSQEPAPERPKAPQFAVHRWDALDRVVLEEMNETRTPGCSIALVENGEVAYVKAYSTSSIETKLPTRADMLFRIGSMMKMHTAATFLKLAERRNLDVRPNRQLCDRTQAGHCGPERTRIDDTFGGHV
jgi:CubicO group peptidase (beta-lactamase class C family)